MVDIERLALFVRERIDIDGEARVEGVAGAGSIAGDYLGGNGCLADRQGDSLATDGASLDVGMKDLAGGDLALIEGNGLVGEAESSRRD